MTDQLRRLERSSIEDFIRRNVGVFSGRTVVDVGCGTQRYKHFVESVGGVYEGFDRAAFPGSVTREDVGDLPVEVESVEAILCTQVVQYVANVPLFLNAFRYMIKRDGVLVLTYPTNWPEVESVDLHRFTRAGMELLLANSSFEAVVHERRAAIPGPSLEVLALGYGVVARPV